MLEINVKSIKEKWDSSNALFIKSKNKLVDAVRFLLNGLDDLINAIEPTLLTGPDKKASVMISASAIYDYIIPTLLPIWLKPFSIPLKALVINVIVSSMVDFIVAKYKQGEWNGKTQATQQM